MLSKEILKIERENQILKEMLFQFEEKLKNSLERPKSCKFCKYYIQHYVKGGEHSKMEYVPIYAGHCVVGVPVKHGGKKSPKPDECCPYFEIGTYNLYENERGWDRWKIK